MNPENKRFLLITAQGVGNTILALPIMKALKNRGGEIHVILSDNGSSEIVKLLELANRIYVWKEKQNRFLNLFRLIFALMSNHYEAAYALCPAGRRENTLLRLSRASQKWGWRTKFPRKLFSASASTMLFWDEKKHDLNSNQALMGFSESEICAGIEEIEMRLNPPSGKKSPKKNNIVIGIQPFTKNQAKCWPADRYKDLLLQLEQKGRQISKVVLFGSLSEEPGLKSLKETLPGNITISAGQKWSQVLSELTKVDFFIGVDSAMAHLSAMAGISTCVLFAYTDPRRVCPVGRNVFVVQTNYPCCPCYSFASGYIENCPYNLRCIQDLKSDEAAEIFSRLIEKNENRVEIRSAKDFVPKSERLAFATDFYLINKVSE